MLCSSVIPGIQNIKNNSQSNILWQTCGQHHSEESDKEVGMFPQRHVSFTTGLLELLKLFGLQAVISIGDGVNKVVW